jgi:hypothetical protein
MNKKNIENALGQLAIKRPIFHSEADFQFALAWQLQSMHPNANIRLEKPISRIDGNGRADIWIDTEKWLTVVELKYRKLEFVGVVNDENYNLKLDNTDGKIEGEMDSDLQNISHFIKNDLTNFGSKKKNGFVILLTHKESLHKKKIWGSWNYYSTVFGKCLKKTGKLRDDSKFDEKETVFKYVLIERI